MRFNQRGYKHEENCDVLVNLDACNNQPGRATRDYVTNYHSDANMSSQLEQGLREMVSATPTMRVKAIGRRNLWTALVKRVIINWINQCNSNNNNSMKNDDSVKQFMRKAT
jgi:hypothetical protein